MLVTQQTQESLVILSPAPDQAVAARAPAVRLTSLAGKYVGLLDNNKPGARPILDRLAARLVDEGAADVRHWRKSHPSGPSPYVSDAAGASHLVISGVGDCGSCSSWSLRDAFEVELAGVPTVTLVSHPFANVVRVEARSLGMPSLPILATPHPIATLTNADLQAIADDLFDSVVRALVKDCHIRKD